MLLDRYVAIDKSLSSCRQRVPGVYQFVVTPKPKLAIERSDVKLTTAVDVIAKSAPPTKAFAGLY
jgi:hypothetical protein